MAKAARALCNAIRRMILAQLRGWSYNTSRDVCTYIHPDNATAVVNPKGMCSEAPYLIVVVCSAVANVNARLVIRNTWGNRSNLETLYNSTVKVAFLLGLSDNDTLNVSFSFKFVYFQKYRECCAKYYIIFRSIYFSSILMGIPNSV